MKVVLVNHSDTRGGASVVTLRLMQALRQAGVDASMLVTHKATDSPYVHVAGPAWRSKAAFLAEHAEIFLRNGLSRANLFKASIATCGLPLHRHPLVEQADVVVLNWINQGMLSLKEISRIKAPVVWTMHDIWPMTGVCHHTGGCNRYMRSCGHCHLMHGGSSATDLSSHTWRRKLALYDRKPIHFIAVSSWLAEQCARSALLRDRTVSIIPNAFPVADFAGAPAYTRAQLGLPDNKRLIVMGAARIDDPIKGLPMAIEALNTVATRTPDAMAVFFGAIRNPEALTGLRMPYVHLGPVSDGKRLQSIYAHSRCVLSSSHYETLPGTLIEGMAAGCVPVAYDHGGQRDIITHGVTGYLARYPDTADLAAGIESALTSDIAAASLLADVDARFSADAIAQKYINLFKQILS